MDTREQTGAQFAQMSDEELRAASTNPTMPAQLLPALRAELRSRRAGASADHQPWQHSPTTAVVQLPTTVRVVVTDVHMSFGSMVVFMVKWALASIPAAIILVLLYFLVVGLVAAVIGGH